MKATSPKKNNFLLLQIISAAILACSSAISEEYAEVWPENPGSFIFINCQSNIPFSDVKDAIQFAVGDLCIKTSLINGEPPELAEASRAVKKLGAKGILWIVNNPAYPVSLGAIEDEWGVLNVSSMLVDNPSNKIRKERFIKYISRLFGSIHGANDSAMMPGCVMNQAIGLKGIDALKCSIYSPEAIGKIQKYCVLAGYKLGQIAPYEDACQEGWAPAPTNDIQKAIWNKIHAIPEKPMKITYDNAAKKPVVK